MQYKPIVHELLQQHTQLHEKLRLKHRLMPTIETYAKELKASHEEWQEMVSQAQPGSDPVQVASVALEMALQELQDRLQRESQTNGHETLSLDDAIAFVRNPTSRG